MRGVRARRLPPPLGDGALGDRQYLPDHFVDLCRLLPPEGRRPRDELVHPPRHAAEPPHREDQRADLLLLPLVVPVVPPLQPREAAEPPRARACCRGAELRRGRERVAGDDRGVGALELACLRLRTGTHHVRPKVAVVALLERRHLERGEEALRRGLGGLERLRPRKDLVEVLVLRGGAAVREDVRDV